MDYIMETQPMDFQDDTLSDTEDRVRVGNLNITSSDSTSIQKFAVYEGINLIGREESCNIQLISKSISKKHAIIEINDNAQFVYDLGSRNKTRKGKMVFKPYVKYPLESEEIITFGDMRGIFTTTRKKAGALLDDDATDSMSDDDSCSETDSESMLPIINDSILDGEENLEKNVDMEKQVDMLLAGNLENTESKIPERITPEHSENNSTTVEKELNEPSPVVINPTPGFLPKKRSYKLHQDSTIPENTTNNSSEILSTLQQHQTLKQDVHISETNFNSHDADNSTEKNPHTEVAETIDDTADSPELTATMPVEHDSPKGHFSSAWNYANEEAVVDSDETDNDEDCINSLDDIETQQFVDNNTNQITNTQSVQSLSMIANDSASQNSIDDLATQPYAFQSPEKPSITSLPISSTSLPGGSSVSIASTDAKDGNKNQEIENLELDEATQRYCSDPTSYDDIATQAFVQDSPSKTNKSQVSEIGKDIDFFESTQRYVGETNKLNKSFDNIATQDYLLDSPIKTNKIDVSSPSQKEKVVDVAEPTQGYTNSYDDVATQAFPVNINTIDKLQTTLDKNDDALNTSDDEISTQAFVGELKDSYDDVATQAFPVNINTIDKLQTTLHKNDDALNTSDDDIATQPFVGELKDSYDDVATQAFPVNINTIDKLQTTLHKNDDALNTSDDDIATQPFVGALKDSYDDVATQAFPVNINTIDNLQTTLNKNDDALNTSDDDIATQPFVGALKDSYDDVATQAFPVNINTIDNLQTTLNKNDDALNTSDDEISTQPFVGALKDSYDGVATQAFPVNINTIDNLQTTLNKNDDALNTSDDEISTQPFVGELKDSYDDVATQAFPVNINTIDNLQTTLNKNDDALNTSDDEISTQPFVGELKNIDSKEESEIPYVDNSVDDDDGDMNVVNQSFDTDDTALNKAESQYFFDETIPSSESEDEENSDPSKNDSDSKSETNNFDPQSAEKKIINQSVLKGVFETAISPKNNPTEKPIDSDSCNSHNSSRENKTIACERRGKRKATKSIKDYCFRKTSQENVENDTVSSNISNEHEANETNVLSTDDAMQTKKLSVEKEKTNTGSSSKADETPENAMETACKQLNEIENNENVEDKKEKKSNTDNSFNASATSSLAKKQTRKTRARKKLNPPRKNSRSSRNNLNAIQNNSQSEIEDLHESVTDKSLNKKEKQTKTNNKVTKMKSVITTDIETEEETKMDFTVSVSHQENSNDSNKTSNSSSNNNDPKKNNQNKTHTDEQEIISSRSKRLSKRKIESNMKSNSQKKNRTSETSKTIKTRSIDLYYEETNQKSQPKINKLNSNNEKSSSSPSSSSPKNIPKNIKLNERKISLNENSNVDISSSTSVTNSPPKTRDRRKTAINEQSGVSTSSNSVVNSTNKSKIRGKIAINKQPNISTSSSITDSPNKTRSRKRAAVSEQPDVSTSSIVDPLNKTKNESEANSVNKHSSSSSKHDASSKAKSNVGASVQSNVSSPLSSQVSQSPNSSKSRRKSTVNEKYNVIFTGISHKAMEKVIKDAGGNVVDCISNATVLVTDKVRRTVKFLCALSKGIPIVGESWLTAIKSRKMFPNPQEYLLVDKNSEKQYEFSLERSLQTASETPLLKDFEIYVTNKVQPDPKAMKEIVTSAGGKFLNKQPTSAKGNLIVISCPEDKSVYSKLLKQKICVCTSELILKGVLQQKVDTTLYVLEENIGRKTSSNESAIDPENKTKDVPNKKIKLDTASNTNSTKKSTNRKSTRTRTSSK